MKTLLDGKIVRDSMVEKMRADVAGLGVKPCLVILQVGEVEESNAYIGQKKKFGASIGVEVVHTKYAETVTEAELIADIKKLNADKKVHGIILQLPIPENLRAATIIDAIDPIKDVDGLTSANLKLLARNDSAGLVPATTKGILALLDYYHIEIAGKRAVMVGRSMLVGKPTALALLNRHATVTIAHSKTQNLAELTRMADILVVAIGKPKFITAEYVREGQIVIDVGINMEKIGLKEEIQDEKPKVRLVGDVDFENVKDVVGAISPVPGGVGAMTVAALFENVLEAAVIQ